MLRAGWERTAVERDSGGHSRGGPLATLRHESLVTLPLA